MQIDYSAITETVTAEDIKSYKNQGSESTLVKKTIIYLVIAAIIFLVISIALGSSSKYKAQSIIWSVFLAAMVAVIFVIFEINSWRDTIKKIHLQKFAKINNFIFIDKIISSTERLGMIFSIGSYRTTHDIIRNKDGSFEIGSHDYQIGSGKNKRYVRNGYIKIKLNRQLPHMVLDSKKNNKNFFSLSMSNLPISFTKDQVLQLEGDFNSSFTLYAPKEYERDALYVFSPDLMALFVDNVHNYDAEIIDDNLYIYSQTPFKLLDLATLKNIFNIIDLVGKKAISQTKRYFDEKVDSVNPDMNVVDKTGRRLKIRISKVLIIMTSILFIYWLIAIVFSHLPAIIKFIMTS